MKKAKVKGTDLVVSNLAKGKSQKLGGDSKRGTVGKVAWYRGVLLGPQKSPVAK